MKGVFLAFLMFASVVPAIETAQAQTPDVGRSANTSLTPMQQEMLKIPGNHLCGDAVTNASCDELKQAKKNNYYQAGHANARPVSMADIASWTPPLVQEIASQGWTLINDSEQERAWFASIASRNNPNLHELALKVAYKGLSGHASKIDIVRGVFLCGTGGEPPDYLQEPLMFTATGDGIPMDDGGELPPIAIAPGSILAVAVTKSCRDVQSSSPPVVSRAPERQESAPSSGPCSIPRPAYPVQAIRQGHQGVVYVTLTVGANERPTDIHVYRSSGFPELDASAVKAMANVVCNVAPGTHIGTPVTFSLNKLN